MVDLHAPVALIRYITSEGDFSLSEHFGGPEPQGYFHNMEFIQEGGTEQSTFRCDIVMSMEYKEALLVMDKIKVGESFSLSFGYWPTHMSDMYVFRIDRMPDLELGLASSITLHGISLGSTVLREIKSPGKITATTIAGIVEEVVAGSNAEVEILNRDSLAAFWDGDIDPGLIPNKTTKDEEWLRTFCSNVGISISAGLNGKKFYASHHSYKPMVGDVNVIYAMFGNFAETNVLVAEAPEEAIVIPLKEITFDPRPDMATRFTETTGSNIDEDGNSTQATSGLAPESDVTGSVPGQDVQDEAGVVVEKAKEIGGGERMFIDFRESAIEDKLAKAQKDNLGKMFTIDFTTVGWPFTNAGDPAFLFGTGKFDGIYKVKRVVHRIGSSPYEMEVNLFHPEGKIGDNGEAE